MTRVLVCGGRNFADHQAVKTALDILHRSVGIDTVVTGCAAGADKFARNWALGNEIDVHVFAAKWTADGRKAGPLRNARMLADGAPDIVVVFPGGRGTADMRSRAEAAEKTVIVMKEDGTSECTSRGVSR